jgi:hypothetical protein
MTITELEGAALVAFVAENPGTLFTIQQIIQKIKDAITALIAAGKTVNSITTRDILNWIQAHP